MKHVLWGFAMAFKYLFVFLGKALEAIARAFALFFGFVWKGIVMMMEERK